MITRIAAAKVLSVLTAVLIAGCHNSSPSQANTLGIPGPGGPELNARLNTVTTPPPFLAYGTVTALGSVWVNGKRYDTSTATIRIDDRNAHADEIQVGDVVRVTGKPGFAADFDVKRALHGPISSVDASGSSFVALGQTVVAGAGVIFDESVPQRSLAGLAVGDIVQVAGLTGGDGKIFASRIAKKPLGPLGYIVTGTATNLDQGRFTVGGLAVDSRSANTSLPRETVVDGDCVEVVGTSLSASGELVATEIRPDDPRAYLNTGGMAFELEGVISAHDPAESPASFTVHCIRVATTASTRFLGPEISSWLGAKVEVEGQQRCYDLTCEDGVTASTVRFMHPTPVALRARVDSVDAAAGTLVVLGIGVQTRPFTRMTDSSAIQAQPFGLANLAAGDFVHVAGAEVLDADALVVASLVERIDAENETQLQGYAHGSMLYRTLDMLGVAISTTATTRYPTPSGDDLGWATFFFDLENYTLLHVRGVEVADRELVASEVRYVDWPR